MDGGELLELHCPICYGEQGESGYSTLVCGHIFHEKCLSQSLRLRKECPSCRCPARPLDTGRRDANSQPKCPCKTGQPLRLFHLQRPRSGADATSTPGHLSVGAVGSAVDSAILAAVEQRAAQRESRLREALQEERERAATLEAQLEAQLADIAKTQARVRFGVGGVCLGPSFMVLGPIAMGCTEHMKVQSGIVPVLLFGGEKAERRKQRLAAQERDHKLATARLSEDKSRLEARERELAEELTRVRQALHGTRMDLEKARAAVYERDDAVMRLKREVAMQRARAGGSAALQPRELAELLGERKEDWQAVYSMKVEELRRAGEVAAELRAEVTRARTDADSAVAAERLAGAERVKAVAQERDDAKRELMELEQQLRVHELGCGPESRPGVTDVRRNGTSAAGEDVGGTAAVDDNDDDDGDEGDLEALALEAIGYFGSEEDEDDDDDGLEEVEGKKVRRAGGAEARDAAPHGRSGSAAGDSGADGGGGDNLADHNTPYDTVTAGDEAPPSKRQRHDGGGSSSDGAAVQEHGSGELIDDSEPVPLLPRAFSGLFAGPSSARPGSRTVQQQQQQQQQGGGAARWSGGWRGGASGGGSGSSLLGEGPDGRGGTSRFPLTSSFGHNNSTRKVTSGKTAGRGGGGGVVDEKEKVVTARTRLGTTSCTSGPEPRVVPLGGAEAARRAAVLAALRIHAGAVQVEGGLVAAVTQGTHALDKGTPKSF
ncbi:hypothetical protein VOLCADRAFT_95510 [Volvox carteri f. nagariensis]|uniref:RING-type domain-containing protein n=1 Tax=Volvox carteri f. nagariensis TaxID=3068 RepID=D8U7N5_VOLCA|nr:uncharacterized protein VOLCADRAFT_95510 [Volvox carteri f. nagariensis]EFJ44333.1 hypothetical protein VOLCADRAFT_95510 [Volvox carteri f. nagariensis]|eukprot:XP_002954692.1 hypothetical protein VOLCADRAFT_95510 [Volvox carteri f. nagariensis]